MRRFLRQICFHICSPPPQPLYNRPLPPLRRPSPASMLPVSDYSRRLNRQPFPPDCSPLMLDHSPLTDYPREPFPPESPVFESEQLLFGPLDMDDSRRHDPSLSFPWDATGILPSPVPTHSDTASPASSASLLDFATSPPSSDLSFTPGSYPGLAEASHAFPDLDDRNLYSNWLVDDLSAPSSASVPIVVSSAPSNPQPPFQSNHIYGGNNSPLAFPKMGSFSPSLEYPTIRALPRSVEEAPMTSISPPQISQPSWAAAQFWNHADTTGANASPLPQLLHPPDESDNFATQRPHRGRNNSLPVHAIFQSSSAPPGFQVRTPPQARGYSRRADSVSTDDDFDGTIRRKRKMSVDPASSDRTRQAEGRSSFFMTSSFPAYMITNSSSKVSSAAPQAGSLCLAALLYGLDSATPGN